MSTAAAYKKLSQREHVLARPGMYIGSVETETCGAWVLDDKDELVFRKDVKYVPGLFKIYDEIIVNAIDHATRVKRQKAACEGGADVTLVKKIAVDIDRISGVISVTNDGDGIPVELHEEHGCHVPELIFGHLLTSANYDDDEDKDRTIGGQNGIGAKACNIFCRWFEIDVVDRVRRKHYTQRFEDNMERTLPPVVKASGAKKPYVTVRFLPDYQRFGMEDGALSDDMYAIMRRRAYDVTAVTDPDVAVFLDGKKIEAKSFERYVDMYLKGAPRVYEKIAEGWELAVGLVPDGGGLQQVSFVNGVATLRGGKHVDHVVQTLCKRVADLIASKKKESANNVRPQFIRDGLFVFLRATVPNPAFDSQSKETLVTPVSKFGVKLEISDRFVDKLCKMDGLVERVVGLSDAVAAKGVKKTDGSKRSTITGVKKLDDAEWAGTAKSHQCTLILTEGDSAKAMAVAGLSIVGRQRYGVYPLRGKLLNVCDVSMDKIAANEEISNLKKILGLQAGKEYTSTRELRYGRIMAMTDQDTDGTHIRGLIFNLFMRLWPSLLKIEGFMTAMLTPIVKAIGCGGGAGGGGAGGGGAGGGGARGGGGGGGNNVLSFYNIKDFEAWMSEQKTAGTAGRWRTKYYKGLGTSTAEEAREYFRNMRIVVYVWDDATSHDALCMSFDKKRADERKAWLQTYDPQETLDYGRRDVSFREFVDMDLKHFSNYDVQRSIPSAIDGFKVSQRKAFFGCLKRNLKEELRVAQLAAYVAEHSMFHHGEASMQGTLIGMAQDFVGSNNVNLLEPVGQFGTRAMGGANHGSPRYIHTHLTPLARLIFHKDDDDTVLRYLEDDGTSVEPDKYLPIIPMVLVNGALGIGTGYSTSVPCYNPRDLVDRLRLLLHQAKSGEAMPHLSSSVCPPLKPWFRGFKGSLCEIKGKTCSRGVLERPSALEVRVTELPIGYWTEDFKEAVEAFVDKTPGVKSSFANNSTHVHVDFTVSFDNRNVADHWMTTDENGVTALETELKMIGHKMLSTTNMHLFNSNGQIRKYDTPEDILIEYFGVRLEAYVLRRERLLAAMRRDAEVVAQKVAFLEHVIEGRLQLHNRTSGDDLDAAMDGLGLMRVDGAFKYLLGMAMASMTRDRKEALEKELVKRKEAIAELEATDGASMWLADLDALVSAL